MSIDDSCCEVARTHDAFEVRRLELYLEEETPVRSAAAGAGNQGFRVLAGYTFRGNKGARKIAMTAPVAQASTNIAMTAPVTQSASDDAYVIQLAMPSKWALEALPEPIDSSATLCAVPAGSLAFTGYSGTWSQSRYEEHLKNCRTPLPKLACVGMASRCGSGSIRPGSTGSCDAMRSGWSSTDWRVDIALAHFATITPTILDSENEPRKQSIRNSRAGGSVPGRASPLCACRRPQTLLLPW